jgi:glycerophosphoryl diester phosphodiesterase
VSHLRCATTGPEAYDGPRVVTPGLVRAAHARGLRVDVWTVDEESDMRRLLGFGVDGVMTDRPDLLARVLEDSGADRPARSDSPAPT